jgi:RimJ/RimL family protein N-acetyltransferase
MPSFPALPTSLSDGVVTLRQSAERDIPEVLIAYQDDPTLHRALGEARPPSGAALGRRAEEAEHDRSQGRGLTLTILQAGSDACCGEVRVAGVDWPRGRAEVAIWVAPQLRSLGIAGRAQALVRDWLWQECGLRIDCPGQASGHLAG